MSGSGAAHQGIIYRGSCAVEVRAQGRAFVLAWQDYAEDPSQRLDCYRWLIGEAKLNLRDNVGKIVRWLEGH